MTLFLIALVVATLLAAALLWYAGQGYESRHITAGITGAGLGPLCAAGLIVYAVVIFNWIAAKHQAAIINREYGTNYTQSEVFYASDVIDAVRELDRKRVEVNGDLLRGEKPE